MWASARCCSFLLLVGCVFQYAVGFPPSSFRRRELPFWPAAPQRKLSSHDGMDGMEGDDNIASAEDTNRNRRLLQDLKKDLDVLSDLRPNDPSADPSGPHALVSAAGSSYTRMWTTETWKSHSKPPHQRYWRHVVARWRYSTTARMVLPAVLISVGWSALVSMLYQCFSSSWSSLAPSAVSFLSAPLALLLTLRANHSMSRLLEARLAWGRLVLHSRSLSSLARTYLFDQAPSATILLIRHLSVLSWMLKAVVRGESRESQIKVIQTVLHDESCQEDYQWLIRQPKLTVAIVARIRQIIHSIFLSSLANNKSTDVTGANNHHGEYISAVHLVVEERLAGIELVLGICDRLLSSPIPPTYSRHLSRAICLWLLFLPLSLAKSVGTWSLMTVMAATSYVMIGIDEMGVEIENAFALLPLQQLAVAAQTAVRDNFAPDNDMPNVVVG